MNKPKMESFIFAGNCNNKRHLLHINCISDKNGANFAAL